MNKILNVCINQTFDYISCATTSGYEIYQIKPFNKKHEYNFNGSLSLTHMLYSTNIIVCVGGIHVPTYKNSKSIFIWDMNTKEQINSYLCCQPISSILINHRHIIINYQDHIEILSLNTCKSLTKFKTCMSPSSACKVYNNVSLLAFTSYKEGNVRLWKKNTIIELKVHDSSIVDIHLSVKCDTLVTISHNHIKTYDIESLKLIHCITINQLQSNLKYSIIDEQCEYILLYFTNELMHIFEIKSGMFWNLFIENVLFAFFLTKQHKNYPKICVLKKDKTLHTFQLLKYGNIIRII